MRYTFCLLFLCYFSNLWGHSNHFFFNDTELGSGKSKRIHKSENKENYYTALFKNYEQSVQDEKDPKKLELLKTQYAQALIDCARYEEALEFINTNDFKDKNYLLIQSYLDLGNTAKAKVLLDEIIDNEDYQTRQSYFKYLIAEDNKDEAEMASAYKRLYSYYTKKKRGHYCRAHELKHIARVFEKTRPHLAWEIYQKSVKRKNDMETYILATRFCQSKFAAGYASEMIKKAVRMNPYHPEALSLHAQILIDEGSLEPAEKALKISLKSRPNHPNAVVELCRIQSWNKNYEQELESLNSALKVYPKSIKLLSRLAAWETLHGKDAKAENIIAQVRQIEPESNDVYLTISGAWEELFKFNKAVEYSKRAEELKKDDWRVLHSIGQNLVRLGEDKEGYEYLERAYKLNKFNYWARNLLIVLDQDFLKDEFKTIETEHFICRIHKEQYPYLKDFLPAVMEGSYENLVGKYKFEPKGPKYYKGKILLLLLKDHNDFSVRTAGVPGLGALGACFGQIITMPPPSIGRDPKWMFNWRWTFEHEFAHILTLQMTDYKIPRWLTEGISTFEEENPRKDIDHLLKWAWSNGKLHKLEDMNDGFFKQSYNGEMVVSYYHSSLLVAYIIEHYGYDKINEILALYKLMDNDLEIIQKALKDKNIQEKLDKYVSDYVAKIPYKHTIDAEEFQNLEAKEKLTEEEAFQKAWYLLGKEKYDELETLMQTLVNSQEQSQYFSIKARLLEAQKKPGLEVLEAYKNVLKHDAHDFKANKYLGLDYASQLGFFIKENTEEDKELRVTKLNSEEIDLANKATQHLEAALKLYPFCPDNMTNLYLPLVEIYKAKEDETRLLDALKRHAFNNNESYQAQIDLALELQNRGMRKESQRSLINAAHVFPYLAEIYTPFAENLERDGKFKEAIAKYTLALSCNERYQSALKGIIRSSLKIGDEKTAQKYLNKLHRYYRDDDWDEWYDELESKTKA